VSEQAFRSGISLICPGRHFATTETHVLLEQMMPDEEIRELPSDAEESNEEDTIFSTEEIKIEEMAIDGICGVY